MESALLLLPLLAGYVIAVTWNGSRYHAAREDGHRLYFRAAFYGCFSLMCGFLITLSLRGYLGKDFGESIFDWMALLSSTPIDPELRFSMTVALVTLIFGSFFGHLLNGLSNVWSKWKLYELPYIGRLVRTKKDWLAYAMQGDELEALVKASFQASVPIAFELHNDKVYIGFPLQSFDPTQLSHGRELRILPLLSGYRESDGQHDLRITSNYEQIYLEVDEHSRTEGHALYGRTVNDFAKVIPLCEIRTYSLFDIGCYDQFHTPRPEITFHRARRPHP
ncbi:hypothetical protein EHZ61_12960 [Aeromonas caviae]|uniref:hypothetical protein n=1 Tax=Aeromonas caviae TaxID=648 RepID=UPI000F5D5B8A|nr:hypothetical protein [Aeromonas caviae]RQX21739.1 hypothetical protein EHZ61_12960 [Aeromonas caviae]